MDKADLIRLGERLRRQTANGSLLEYLDGTLDILKEGAALEKLVPGITQENKYPEVGVCPVCINRRAVKAAAMKLYRARQRAG